MINDKCRDDREGEAGAGAEGGQWCHQTCVGTFVFNMCGPGSGGYLAEWRNTELVNSDGEPFDTKYFQARVPNQIIGTTNASQDINALSV